MANNPYVAYYVNQVGSGISHFQGVKYQRGHGFFSNLWQKALLPFLKTAGRETLKTSLGVAEDAIAGKDIKTAARNRFSATGRQLGSMALKQGQQLLDQDGAGRKRKKNKKARATSAIKKKKSGKKKAFGPKTSKAVVAKYAHSISEVAKPKKRKVTKKSKKASPTLKKTNKLFPF